MFKVQIQPRWTLHAADGQPLPAKLIELLQGVHETGSLAAACRRAGLSYRYAWGLLQQSQALFGAPLLRMARGRGARLTALGERLVWAEQRIAARLAPTLDSLASEVEVELGRALSAQAAPPRVHAAHGFAVETLRRFLDEADAAVDLKYRSPGEALDALRAGACDLAGVHLPIGEFERDILAHYAERIDPHGDRVLHLATRRIGLILAPGNPKRIGALADLLRSDVRFIHRQPGSGARLLLERMLARQGLSIREVRGCGIDELTHAAVAAYVASGMADAGFGLETPARRYGLEFVPVASEHYFFLARASTLESPALAEVLAILRSERFRAELGKLPGYDAGRCGEVQTLPDAFASARQVFA
ncbi:ModE molybdate transport repressor domain-containing protein [Lysobacter sp. yr284]|uniref:helix-turn-helix transcriptional regulator n=1 Tax=Lysobacter TaxID=68 RepID=UPI000895E9AC|nr:substrate-binding domain-containing protein [Lysobacter sp. yr284]SDY42399.1 ModE molybdate transport repressor domain-containing protein [Lysobacter sp. yr284]